MFRRPYYWRRMGPSPLRRFGRWGWGWGCRPLGCGCLPFLLLLGLLAVGAIVLFGFRF